jgi:hypothetical protein
VRNTIIQGAADAGRSLRVGSGVGRLTSGVPRLLRFLLTRERRGACWEKNEGRALISVAGGCAAARQSA